ncbi:hypothetical protein AKJ40_01950 [candidate division MSBL1 archaeon SCGC-AAA259M10]|uniref:ATP-dependent helicase C-terminal domain-containing protein n=3 Tax=candidate division MSBL1 TaxID=215777 RepID=A0A133U7N8_9EURY|nr:hypothetical protein AKJ62_01500 [candidate division MSBL1 archaeon SCGC-AAA259D14]KXA93719.1 hypothetical protein AKJ66_01220 [candidate division MSBL1 archaeon SCGC-AAA259E22]KXB00062.1 hypothetical protein AKJ40_01950 [candidate division MSBL1 archaeon SCGC-AAA259M10]
MTRDIEDLSEKTSNRLDRLAENWDLDRDRLDEEFERIYSKEMDRGEDEFSSDEERQKHAVEKLSVEVAVDRDRFTKGPRTEKPSKGERRSGSRIDLRLFDERGSKLDPLTYSTGKDQAEVVEEILEAFESSDLVFLKGVVGSGKSVVGIRTALEFGKGTVSVPTKVLSHQYREDYEKGKYFLTASGEKAEIKVLKGRRNFTCPYLEEEHPEARYKSCQNRSLPCSRPLGRDESRLEALKECPYWGFIFPTSAPLKKRSEHVGSYRSLSGRHSLLLKGEGKCPYWSQFDGYLSADVNVMNSKKWEVEALIGRLPLTGVTVIDEADAWLDGLSSRTNLSGKRIGGLVNTLREGGLGQEAEKVGEIWTDYQEGVLDPLSLAENLAEVLESIELGTNLYWELKRVMDFSEEMVAEGEEDSVTYYIPDPEPVLSKFLNQVGGKWLLMSATVQDREVLNKIYGIDPVFVEGEVEFPGELVQRRLGSERVVSNRMWQKPSFRRGYARVRDEILERAERPCFVPVHATKYLPDHIEGITRRDRKEVDGVVFSTKMDRGADLGEMESVVLLKYPFPNLGDPLLKATRKRLGEEKFWMYYHDMTEREFIQQIGRTVRSPDDRVEFWSPDAKCHRQLRQSWQGDTVKGGASENR